MCIRDSYNDHADLETMYREGARPIDILFRAMVIFGVMDLTPAFPAELSDMKKLFEECRPLLSAARIAQKTADRCRTAVSYTHLLISADYTDRGTKGKSDRIFPCFRSIFYYNIIRIRGIESDGFAVSFPFFSSLTGKLTLP